MKLIPILNIVPGYMNESGSLTKQLKARCNDFHIMEQQKGQLGAHSFYRQSILMSNLSPLIFALSSLSTQDQTVINKFCNLGGKSLGEQLLFSEYKVRRSQYEFFQVIELSNMVRNVDETEIYYARRSHFRWQGNQLSLLEVFLPGGHNALKEVRILSS